MPVSAIDSLLFRNLFGTPEVRALFSDKSYIQRCLDVEAALARSQSKLNIIPPHAGEAITRACANLDVDYDRLSDETEIVGYPILPLVRQLTAACGDGDGDGEGGKYVHWGATTQDIQDTATVLQMKAGLQIVEEKLRALVATLGGLAKRYRDAPMAGRTHLQHALPVTFGYKCAVYLSGFQRHLERLGGLRPRGLVVQFGGAAGTLASLGSGEEGLRVRKALAEELGLGDPGYYVAYGAGRCGGDLGEVSEPFVPHRGASSTMPQKRNPISSEVILAASKILRANAGLCLDAIITDFERASGPWHLEWVAVPESFVVAVGALSQAEFALSGLVVNTKQMERNLDSSKGLIVAEAVMMDLAGHIGRQQAHDLIYDACNETIEAGEGTSLFDVLSQDERVTGAISKAKLADLCKPANYLGAAGRMVDNVLAFRAGSSGQPP
ncbi:hypothetical protein LTS02_011626 [Friedmanniomyces endolithicus]|nr:hypothetical protein LTS02_011626 [Friedmanniomyces endolithicus]